MRLPQRVQKSNPAATDRGCAYNFWYGRDDDIV